MPGFSARHRWLFCSLIGLCLVDMGCKDKPQGGPGAAATVPDTEAIVGTWKVTGVNDRGQAVPDAEVQRKTIVWTFDGKRLVTSNGKITGAYHLEPGKTPRQLDVATDEGTPFAGVYELAGDDLKVCAPKSASSTTRPTSLAPATESTIFTLKRDRSEKPK